MSALVSICTCGAAKQDQLADAPRWYAVHTHPHAEEAVQQQLALQSFETYLPRSLRTVRHARRIVTKRSAYFDCYLFVSLDVERQRWRAINGTPGVRSLVMCGERPLAVPAGLVEALISATDEAGILQSATLLELGGKVRVRAGVFTDQLGTLDHLDGRGAVTILLDIMSRQVPVRVRREQIVVLS